MSSLSEDLRQEYTIETPESVSFSYAVAGIGNRFIGALVDLLIVVVLLLLLNIVLYALIIQVGNPDVLFVGLEADAGWLTGLIIAFYALLQFAIIWGYFMVFEMLWNGQTPGKWVVGTRVVRLDGEPAGFSEVAIRNLVRFVDFMPTAYAIGFVTMLFNDKSRRLGDFAAGTLVVRERSALVLADLGNHAPIVPATQETQDTAELYLRRMSHEDYALIRDALDRDLQGRLPYSTLARLAALSATKLEAPPPPPDHKGTRDYLSALAEAWERKNQ